MLTVAVCLQKASLYCKEIQKYLYYLEVWNSALTCSFKALKMETWQSNLNKVLKVQYKCISQNDHVSIEVLQETAKFQQRIIEMIPVSSIFFIHKILLKILH